MALFLAIIAVPLIVGVYFYLRERESVLAAHKLPKHPRLGSLLFETDEWAGVLAGAPVALSVMGGVCVFAFRCAVWLATANMETFTIQRTWGWPTTRTEIDSGFLGLDKILWWLMADAPLELWLIVIFPLIWVAALSLPTAIAKKIWRRLQSELQKWSEW
jgi:hypothetical protein